MCDGGMSDGARWNGDKSPESFSNEKELYVVV